MRQFSATVLFLLLFTGCVSGPLREARNAFYSGNPENAAQILSETEEMSGRDKLLILMEKGLILHDVGRYRESADTLIEASELIDRQDVISISEQTASMVTSEWATEFKGEQSERLWVHTYLMMNFLLLDRDESALVEAKQALKILDEHSETLADDHFTRALIALCFENLGELDGAYIEYKKLAENISDASLVAPDLYRLARKLGYRDEALRHKETIPVQLLRRHADTSKAELVLFAGLGRNAEKVSGDIIVPPAIRFSFPRYKASHGEYMEVDIFDSGRRLPLTAIASDMESVSKAVLEERKAKIIVKETARVAAKETIAQSVEHHNELAGVLVRLAFMAMEEADTRCWRTLPASLQLIRIPLEPGRHNIRVLVRGTGDRTVEEIVFPEFEAYPGGRVFFSLRTTG